jgi:hypothetical protein
MRCGIGNFKSEFKILLEKAQEIMKTLEIIYWLRSVFGIIAGLVCIGYGWATDTITSDLSKFSVTTLFNGAAFALIVYLLSYYVIKFRYKIQVEKPQKLMTTGFGIYALSWLVTWILLYTLIAGPPPATV